MKELRVRQGLSAFDHELIDFYLAGIVGERSHYNSGGFLTIYADVAQALDCAPTGVFIVSGFQHPHECTNHSLAIGATERGVRPIRPSFYPSGSHKISPDLFQPTITTQFPPHQLIDDRIRMGAILKLSNAHCCQ
ncbi:MAG: hypothetical protein KME16_14505 [Scytolyngbya sp. HA4215-MV1]|nr:hypothetical protein [Scytolyngbya sp. HA4215-MV1]